MSDPLDPIFQQEEQRRLRAQLFWRLGIAIIILGGALGGILWLEQQQVRPTPATPVNSPRIAPPVATPLPSLAPSPASEPAASQPQMASAPAESASSALAAITPQATATPFISPAPVPTERQIRSANSKPVLIPLPTPPSEPATTSSSRKAETSTPPVMTQQPAPLSTPFSITERQRNVTVQAGVFLHAAKAEKLLAQLQRAGIPAYLETRVQIGPFNSKTEAEAAIKKLRSMGIEPVVRTQ